MYNFLLFTNATMKKHNTTTKYPYTRSTLLYQTLKISTVQYGTSYNKYGYVYVIG